MKLKVQQVFDACLVLSEIIRDKRPTPQKGAYRLARLHAKLLPEFTTIATKRDELITAFGHKEPGADSFSVPTDKMAAFLDDWKKVAEEEIEVDIEPIPLAQLDFGDNSPGTINASELVTLGPLVAE